MNRKYQIIIFILISVACVAFIIVFSNNPKKLGSVNDHLEEISGIEFDKDGNLWAINDGNNAPQLHRLDSLGNITKSITITNGENLDWEDMTQDYFGHFYIGDFGNNANNRNLLTVYKIENPIDIKGNETSAEIIKFKFSDKFDTTPNDTIKNYDLEAFIYYEKALYLFTKNRTKPFDGITNVYKMGYYASNQSAELVGSFKTCESGKYLCWITSAALSPDKKTLALLSSNKMWVFKNWKNDDFFSGDVKEISLGMVTQKEAITFHNDSIVLIADEVFKGIGGNVYSVNINK